MNKQLKSGFSVKKWSAVLVASAMLWSGSALAMGAPFGNKEDVKFAKELWQVLKKNKMVGKERINVRPFEGNEPHGAIQQVLGFTITVAGRKGRALVKANHGGKGLEIEHVYSNPNKFLKAYTVMFKREAGYDPQNKDWFWAKFNTKGELMRNPMKMLLAGRVAKGMEKGCIACHTAAGGADLEVLTDK